MSHNKKSIYKGVRWEKQNSTWEAALQVGIEEITLTGYKDQKEAAKAYDRLCLQYLPLINVTPNGFYKRITDAS